MFNGELAKIIIDASYEEHLRNPSSPELKDEHLILALAGGSSQHGARIEGKSDLDVVGVYIGTPEMELAIGNEDPRKTGHVTAGTSGDHERNSAKDTDSKTYSLRRWAGLALKGNPNVLSYLFTPDDITDQSVLNYRKSRGVNRAPDYLESVWVKHILPNRNMFLASGHAAAFLGLGASQYDRMVGNKGVGKHGQRNELVLEFGMDVKAAMHMIRSMTEALELLETGHMTFPRPEREMLLDIRNGKWSLEHIKSEYLKLREAVQDAEKTSPLPLKCDRGAVSNLIVSAMLDHWKTRGYYD